MSNICDNKAVCGGEPQTVAPCSPHYVGNVKCETPTPTVTPTATPSVTPYNTPTSVLTPQVVQTTTPPVKLPSVGSQWLTMALWLSLLVLVFVVASRRLKRLGQCPDCKHELIYEYGKSYCEYCDRIIK